MLQMKRANPGGGANSMREGRVNSRINKCSASYPKGCAAPGEVPCQCNTWELLSKLKETSPQRKIDVTSKSPVGDRSVVTLIRTDTTLDHSQKAEKVWLRRWETSVTEKTMFSKVLDQSLCT